MSYYVYVIGPNSGPLKIGISTDVTKRRAELNVGNHRYLKILLEHKVENKTEAELLERRLHHEYKETHIRGEWFELEFKDIGQIIQCIHNFSIFEYEIYDWSLQKKTCAEFTNTVCRRARRALELTESALADLAGVHVKTVTDFESGIQAPRLDTIEALKNALEEKGIEFIQQQSGKELKIYL